MQGRATCFSVRDRVKKYGELLICLLFLIALLLFSRAPAENVRRALALCYRTVIPSVFPFMVISSFIIRTGAHTHLASIFGKPIRFLFGCSEAASVSVILGFLSGFPIGASSAVALYDSGEISKEELERLLIFVSNPGAAFVIGGVGAGIFNSSEVGRLLYASVLISSVSAGVISRFFYKSAHSRPLSSSKAPSESRPSVASAFTGAVSDSALNTLTVCACVVFFSVPVGIISELLSPLGFPASIRALLSSFFEISGGCGASGELSSPVGALMICAFACSWSGLSVHLQVSSVCRGRGLSFTPYVISKLLQGVASPLLALALSRLSSELTFADGSTSVSASPTAQKIFFAFFLISLAIMLVKRVKDSRRVI